VQYPKADLTESYSLSSQKKVYTISELNRKVRFLLEGQFASIWVEAEVSNFKKHSSGHMYLSLKDENSQISAAFFSRYNHQLKFQLKDGLKVLVFGKISLYEARGQYQFYIERIEPKGIGALQLAFLQLKEKLQKEGLFDPDHKKLIPKYPNRIGVVTSPTGAAIRDIINVVNRRFHGTQVLIYPVRVQGEGSAAEIAQAIKDMNQMKEVDVVIVGRGGGSIEDLWAFNEEIVARSVYDSKLPIISAVGHEIDWTICDFVSDMRAPTPSAAAEIVVQNREEIENRLIQDQTRMKHSILGLLESRIQSLNALQSSYAFKQPLLLVDQFSQRLDELMRQLQNYLKANLSQKSQTFQGLVGRLNALSPLSILERGYSLSFTAPGELLKDIKSVSVGDALTTRLARGVIKSKVEKILKNDEVKNGN